MVLGAHADRAAEIVGAVARMSMVPVFAKLPSSTPDVVELARGVVRAGAHGITVLDSPPAMGVDAATLRPTLGPVTGWLSGPALKPLTLRAVFEVARALPDTPIVAVGGVRSGEDAVEMLLAGAWAVQVGTATLVDPSAPVEVARGVSNYLEGEAVRVAGRSPRPAARAGRASDVDPASDMIPRPENPLVVALDVSDLERAEALASSARAARRHAEGGARAVLGRRPGGRAAHRVSRSGVRRCEAARHPEHRRAGVREHRAGSACGCSTSTRSAARR